MLFLRRLLLTMGILVVLGLLFHLEENWRGRRSWEAWKASQEAAGHSYAPPVLQEGQLRDYDNLAAASVLEDSRKHWEFLSSLFAALPQPRMGNWAQGEATDFAGLDRQGQDLVQGLAPFGGVLDRLAEAARRPSCNFPSGSGIPTDLHPRIGFLATMARVLHLRAQARVHAGLPHGALEDIVTLLRISRHLQRQPILLAVHVGRMEAEAALQPIWEGLHAHAWTPKQLSLLQEELASIDLPGSLRACQGERWLLAHAAQELDAHPWTLLGRTAWAPSGFWRRGLFCLLPRGWAYQFLAARDRAEAQVQAAGDGPGHRIAPLRTKDLCRTPLPYRWAGGLAGDGARVALNHLQSTARVQASLDQARVACALERFRLTRGAYPGALEELVPECLTQVPHDLLTGAHLSYTAQDGGFRLGATGWMDPDEPVSQDLAKAWTWVSGR